MAKTSSAAAQNAQPTNLPLFFKQPAPLDAKRHAKVALAATQDMSFAATTNSILLNAVEFTEAARQYPIVFTQEENPLPAAILGLESGNYFIDAKNQWKDGAYIPAYVRRYPFVFMEVPEREQLVLCIDEKAPQYRDKAGKGDLPLFTGETPSELTKNALEFCTAFQNHFQITQNFCAAIKEAGLLEPTRSDVKLYNGREIHLSGFQVINEKKVAELPEATILDFHKKGWLPLIYFALMASSNWKRLIDIAAEREKKN